MDYNFFSLGSDCSPASALRHLNLREFALPFDWIVSNSSSIEKCITNNFDKFHTNLKFNNNKQRLIDEYEFEFPHDYPFTNTTIDTNNLGEGVFGEEKGKSIIENWKDYYLIVKEKYNRRIERFKNILNDTKPIIVLCRHSTNEVLKIQHLFIKYYNKDIYFINSNREIFENDRIINIYTEQNGIWNDPNIWKSKIDYLINKL